ncbi:glycoside hydrolase family 19 protein [Undibacterium sp. Dicai25W]|uniref:glycoside hydrolase family 19 protein n=1 Tax=Undibacterium sp. Dicai25W TaxID=3413034 RepID=UPI003BF00DE9
MTLEQLHSIFPLAGSQAELFFAPLTQAMQEFEINTAWRQSAFLAQVGHESAQLLYVQEPVSGRTYEGRIDLGNTQKGDGIRYKGRGLINITGRKNYSAVMKGLGIDCLDQPELLEQPAFAARSAAWYWKNEGLNELADDGLFIMITRRINGAACNLSNRFALYAAARAVLLDNEEKKSQRCLG